MHRVCHITSSHGRYDVRIFEKECRSLAQNQWEVILLVNDKRQNEYNDGVSIITTGFQASNRIDRIIGGRKKMLDEALKLDADIYHLHDPELLLIALKLKKSGKKVIFDSHEDVPGQILGKDWIPKIFRKSISEVYRLYEQYVLKRIDALISVTPHLTARLRKSNPNTVEITNYPLVRKAEIQKQQPERAVCFAGGITAQWMHDEIIQALESITDVKYILCGSGKKEYIDYLKSFKGWEKVEYLGAITHSQVPVVYSRSRIGVAILNYSENVNGKEGTLGNTKLFEIMYAGLPVVCTDFILWRRIIEEYECGICVRPDNVEEIASAISCLLDNPEEAKRMGQNGRKAIMKRFNWNSEERKLLDLYSRLLRVCCED
jgi:glycosyltransferase involved in cell wall biosynthesis